MKSLMNSYNSACYLTPAYGKFECYIESGSIQLHGYNYVQKQI